MQLTDTIETLTADTARTVDFTAGKIAESLPSPFDAVVLRLGAVQAEMIRQTGLVTVTNIDAARGLLKVTFTGVSDLAEATADAVEASVETIEETGRSSMGTARRAGSKIIDQARESVEQIERNFRIVGRRADQVEDRVEDEAEDAADRVVKAADTGAASTYEAGARRPSGPYENWTKDELYDRAAELDIDGRSNMNKTELIRALRSA